MRGKTYSDEELISALRNGNEIEVPVKFIYAEFYGLLANYIENNDGSTEDAEDIFQETVLTFIELVKQEKFRGESAIKTFLYAVNRNLWLNEKRKKGRREKRHELVSVRDEHDPEIEKYIGKRESRKEIFSIIERLGETCKKILIAFYYENLPVADILKLVKYDNEQVVRNKKAKCMKSLQEKFHSDPALADNMRKALQYE